jgi:hypothetical protein
MRFGSILLTLVALSGVVGCLKKSEEGIVLSEEDIAAETGEVVQNELFAGQIHGDGLEFGYQVVAGPNAGAASEVRVRLGIFKQSA